MPRVDTDFDTLITRYLDAQRVLLLAFAHEITAAPEVQPRAMPEAAPSTASEPQARRLTVKEAAAIAGRHPATLHLALGTGELHGYQRARKATWTIYRECLDAWVEGRLCEHKHKVTPIRGRR